MSGFNAAFEKLLEYEQRAHKFKPGKGHGEHRRGETAGVIFRIGEKRLTCSIDHVHEFLPLPACTPVPGTKPWILGLANVRGDLVTIVDLAWFLSGQRSKVTMRSRLLIADLRGRPVGLVVDEVFGQRRFVASDAKQSRPAKKSPLHGYVSKQFRAGTETWHELDLDVLFSTTDFLNGAAV